MASRRVALVLILGIALVVAVAGCGGSGAEEAGPTVAITCDPMEWDPPTRLTCEVAINAAAPKVLALGRGPIVTAAFRYGPWCPPNARCFVGPIPDQGYVMFGLADRGEDLMVDVGVRNGIVWAGEPQPVPGVLIDPPAP